MSAGIKEALGRLNYALQYLETTMVDKAEQVKLRENQQDLFNAEQAAKVAAAEGAQISVGNSIDPAVLAQRLDTIIGQVEKVMADA